jgi:hypothetical protein
MKLKRKLLAIISCSCPTLNFMWYLYSIWIVWKSFVPHRLVCCITLQICLHLGELFWTKYVRAIICALPACWSNQKSILFKQNLTSAASRLEFVTTRNCETACRTYH